MGRPKKDPVSTACQFWAATWNDPKPESDLLIKFLNERGWKYVFQEEAGETTHRPHFQMRLNLGKENRCVKHTLLEYFNAGGFDTKQFTPSPESMNGLKADGSIFYCMKPERLAGPWTDDSFTMPKQKVKYNGEDLACMEKPFGWQQHNIDMIDNIDPDDRHINWVCNLSGNCGKSKLQKYMCWKGTCKRISLGLAHQIKNAVATARSDVKCYMMNIPRVSGKEEAQRELFSAIEEIKDGWVSAVMFGEEKEYFFKPPHVWIYSNQLPDRKLASPDRWKVWVLESPTQEKLIPWDGNPGASL